LIERKTSLEQKNQWILFGTPKLRIRIMHNLVLV
jgi:hypothetical protein